MIPVANVNHCFTTEWYFLVKEFNVCVLGRSVHEQMGNQLIDIMSLINKQAFTIYHYAVQKL